MMITVNRSTKKITIAYLLNQTLRFIAASSATSNPGYGNWIYRRAKWIYEKYNPGLRFPYGTRKSFIIRIISLRLGLVCKFDGGLKIRRKYGQFGTYDPTRRNFDRRERLRDLTKEYFASHIAALYLSKEDEHHFTVRGSSKQDPRTNVHKDHRLITINYRKKYRVQFTEGGYDFKIYNPESVVADQKAFVEVKGPLYSLKDFIELPEYRIDRLPFLRALKRKKKKAKVLLILVTTDFWFIVFDIKGTDRRFVRNEISLKLTNKKPKQPLAMFKLETEKTENGIDRQIWFRKRELYYNKYLTFRQS